MHIKYRYSELFELRAWANGEPIVGPNALKIMTFWPYTLPRSQCMILIDASTRAGIVASIGLLPGGLRRRSGRAPKRPGRP